MVHPPFGIGNIRGLLSDDTGGFDRTIGTFPVQVSGLAAANYTIPYEPGILTVDPALLTFRAINKTL